MKSGTDVSNDRLNIGDYLVFIEQLLGEAAKLILDSPVDPLTTVKADDRCQVVTEVDLAVSHHLVDRIRDAYPQHGIVEEETGASEAERSFTWVVDPIDGSSNFAAGSPLYGAMIGLLVDGLPVASGVVLPAMWETYLAGRGMGAYVNDVRLQLSPPFVLSSALVAYGVDVYDAEVAKQDFNLAAAISLRCRGLRIGGSVFDLMMVAKGIYGAFLHQNMRIWDCVAPHLIIQEAGGTYTTFHGNPSFYFDPTSCWENTFSACAASPEVWSELQDIIGP